MNVLSLLRCVALALSLAGAAQAGPLAADRTRIASLPLVVSPTDSRSDTLAIFYSGDGGWVALDKGVASDIARAGVPVVGYDSLRYFMVRKTPQDAAADLSAVMRRYMAAWGKSKVILIGYSFGADALPEIIPKLPADLRADIRLVALVSAGKTGEMQFQPGDWFGHAATDAYPMGPAVAGLRGLPMVCVYGAQDARSACSSLPAGLIHGIRLSGDHHFGRSYAPVGEAILHAAGL